MRERLKLVGDFETVIHPEHTWVWASCLVDIESNEVVQLSNNIDETFDFLSTKNSVCYYHNLKFDGEFWTSYLFSRGFKHITDDDTPQENTFRTLISQEGTWYTVEIYFKKEKKNWKKLTLYDSFKKLPFKAERIAKAFNLPYRKLKIDYKAVQDKDHALTPLEIDYITADCKIIAAALKIQFNMSAEMKNGAKVSLDRMTVGSDALHNFKDAISKKTFECMFPVLPIELDKDIRRAYKGGFTWLKECWRNVRIQDGIKLDVNSLYPWAMYNKVLPYGYPVYFEGEPEISDSYPLYIVQIKCQFQLKKDHIPTITLKHYTRTTVAEYVEDSGIYEAPDGSKEYDFKTLWLTNVDLQLLFDHYDVFNEEYINGFKFHGCTGVFNDYIDFWATIKANNTGALRELAKLMLNSLYGKFATNPECKNRIPYLDANGIVKFGYSEKKFREPVYTAMGAFITAYAREKTIRTGQTLYDRVIYADTDSWALLGCEEPKEIEIHKSKLGAWKNEGTFFDSLYLCPKRYLNSMYHSYDLKPDNELEFMEKYAELLENKLVSNLEKGEYNLRWDELHVTCAAMPDYVKQQVTYANFHAGHVFTGKLYPHHVAGGIVLLEHDWSFHD